MSVTLTNVSYGPAPYVQKNLGNLGINFILDLDLDPSTFQFRVDWIRSNGNIWLSSGDQTLPTQGLSTPVKYSFEPPGPLPPGGIRPVVTVDAGAAGTHSEAFCTGITAVPPDPKPCKS